MKKVLWFSRHEMTADQLAALKRKLGNIEINKIDKTISSAYELKDDIEGADVIAIVAPLNLQSQFLKLAEGKPVIIAQTKRELTKDENGGESKVTFIFDGWKQLEKIEVVMSDFA
jgi:hypothetical protein